MPTRRNWRTRLTCVSQVTRHAESIGAEESRKSFRLRPSLAGVVAAVRAALRPGHADQRLPRVHRMGHLGVHDNPPPVWTSSEILEQSNCMAGRGRNKSG